MGNHRRRGCDGAQERAGIPAGRTIRARGGDAPNGDLAADYARRHGVPRWYSDADELINDPEVDAVYVATPPDSHRDYASASRGPASRSMSRSRWRGRRAECEEMISACEAAGVGLFVAYYRRAMPRFATVKGLWTSGRIGELRSVSIRNERPAPADGTAVGGVAGRSRRSPAAATSSTSGSHTLDLLDWLLGPVTHASGVATNRGGRYPAEDLVTGVFSSAPAWKGSASGTTTRSSTRIRSRSSEQRESLRFSCFAEEPLRLVTARGAERDRGALSARSFNCPSSRPWSMP